MTRLVDALKKVGQTFKLFQRGEIGPCNSTPSPVSIPNLVPSTFCRVPAAAPVPVEEAPAVVEGAVPEVEGTLPEVEGEIVEEPEEIDPSAPDLQIDPQDQRIDVRAKFALQRMLKVPVTEDPDMAKNAARLIRGINGGTLEGIFGDDLGKAVEKAQEHGTERWLLIPKGEDAALVLDKEKPLKGPPPPDRPPTVIFRGDTPDISKQPGRLDEALKEAGQTFELWQQEELGSCGNTGWIVPVSNLVPSSYCTSMGIPSGKSACSTLKRPEILDNFDQGKSDLKLSHKRKISVIARCVKDRHGTPGQIDAISLIGHASTEGDPSFNEILGQQRAEEVRKDLIMALEREMPGLSDEVQIDTETRGPYEPRNLGPEKDRRVEVFLPHKAISTACELLVIVTTAEADHEGAFVKEATVEVTGPLISEKLTDKTNEFGQARFQDLEPGTYHVTASKEGFKQASGDVRLAGNQDQALTFASEGALTSVFGGGTIHLNISPAPGKRRLRIRIIDFFGSPVANEYCLLSWGNDNINQKTNNNGIFEVDVPSPPTTGLLFVPVSIGADMEIEVKLTSFGRASTVQGLKARLINLGYLPVSVAAGFTLDGVMRDEDRRALERFRTHNGLVDKNGVPKGQTNAPFDSATTDRLEDAHDVDTGPLVK